MSLDGRLTAARAVASLLGMAGPENTPSLLAVSHVCVLCNERIESDQSRAAILMFGAADEVVQYQLDAHLNCLRRAAHPAIAERVDPTFFERFKGRRPPDE
jgi:hypothetical protein